MLKIRVLKNTRNIVLKIKENRVKKSKKNEKICVKILVLKIQEILCRKIKENRVKKSKKK